MGGVKELIGKKRIVPVVKLESEKQAIPLAKALMEGKLPIAEITFRTAVASEAIRIIRERYPDMVCGAGTVVNKEQAKKAVEAGAEFLVCPGFSDEVIEYALQKEIPVFPGCCTPTELMKAISYGLDIVKFFPAKQYGGLETIKALAAPFSGVRFMPTGGINAGNLQEFLKNDCIYACGGSWMATEKLIREEKFGEITRLTKEAVDLATEA